jgi:hypothetical protein
MYVFLTIEFVLGLLIGLALRASSEHSCGSGSRRAPQAPHGIGCNMSSPLDRRSRWSIVVADDPAPEWAPYGALELKSVPVQYCRLGDSASGSPSG